MKNSEMLNKAAKLIMDHGHCKGTFSDEKGRHCLVGAIWKVNPVATFEQIEAAFDFPETSLTGWNDKRSTTPAEVVQLLQFSALAEKDEGR